MSLQNSWKNSIDNPIMPLLEKKIEIGCKNSFLKSFSMCGVSPVMFHFAYQFEMEVMKVYTERSNKPYRDKKKNLIALPTINPLQSSLCPILAFSQFLSSLFFSLSQFIFWRTSSSLEERRPMMDGEISYQSQRKWQDVLLLQWSRQQLCTPLSFHQLEPLVLMPFNFFPPQPIIRNFSKNFTSRFFNLSSASTRKLPTQP